MDVASCEATFRRMTGMAPYDFQVRSWAAILERCREGAPVLIEAPTAAGKTEAAITPYLTQHCFGDFRLARRLIYVLPSRSLVVAQERRIREAARRLGVTLSVRVDYGGAGPLPMFFGDVIVTTWDTFLYGLIAQRTLPRRFTIPAGNIATAVVVFDEVQMYQDVYFYTQRLMAQTLEILETAGVPVVVMTATLSATHRNEVLSLRHVAPVAPMPADAAKPLRGELSIEVTTRSVSEVMRDPTVVERLRDEISRGYRGLLVVNTVGRAVDLYKALLSAGWSAAELRLLHSRFLARDRRAREEEIIEGNFGLLIATQVVEAGLDLPLVSIGITEVAPPDALVQRIGRVARRVGETGVVWVAQPREAQAADPSPAPYSFVSGSRKSLLEAALASGQVSSRDGRAARIALAIDDAVRKALSSPGTADELAGAITDLESCRRLVDPFYQELWRAWKGAGDGEVETSAAANGT